MGGFAAWTYRAAAEALTSAVQQESGYLDLVLHDRVLGLAQALDHAHPPAHWLAGTVPELSAWLTRFMASSNQAIFKQVWTADGRMAGKSQSLNWEIPLSPAARALDAQNAGPFLETLVLAEGQSVRLATYPLWADADGRVVAFVQTGIQLPDAAPRLERIRRQLGLGFAVAWGGFAAGLWWLLARAQAPWQELRRRAAGIGAHNFWRDRLPPSADPELQAMVDEINAMLGRIEETYAAHQRFVADSAHELATPLTALRGEIEVALRRDRSPDEYREMLANARTETERLSRLAENLLTLAAADAGEALGPREVFDAAALLRAVAQRFASRAEERGVHLGVAAPAEVRVRTDRDALQQVLVNLTENALRHTPSGGRVTLGAAAAGGEAVLSIADTGEGIASEHLPSLFERFYRVDKARSRQRGGAGLGLAIVKALVEAQHGHVSVDSAPDRGSTFRVHLPLAGG